MDPKESTLKKGMSMRFDREGSPQSPPGATILRRRQKDSPFGAASKALETMKDKVSQAVSFENITGAIASSFAGSPHKKEIKETTRSAPPGITQSYSLVLTHVVAPLWSINAKTIGVLSPINWSQADIAALAAAVDKKGFEVEHHYEVLQGSTELATAFVTLLVAKLLCIESADYIRPNFVELVAQIQRDVRLKGEYEEHFNDETVAHDQARRKLTEVGGNWKPRGAVDLNYSANFLRHKLLLQLFYASVCFKYIYTDENLQYFCDSLASQLFLLSYSESLVSLIGGQKGPNYVAKFLLHLAKPFGEAVYHDCIVPYPDMQSILLQEATAITELAFENLLHRNDTNDTIVVAFARALSFCPVNSLASLFTMGMLALQRMYVADIPALVQLLESTRPFVVHPVPVGSLALQLMDTLCENIRNVNSLQRRMGTRIFVAGAEMRSFRRQPAHIITTPYAARAFIYPKIYLANVDMQRGASASLPVVVDQGLDPASRASLGQPLDDAVLYLANSVINVFQSCFELCHGHDNLPGESTIDLAALFSLPPHVLCSYVPSIYQFLSSEENFMTDPSRTEKKTYEKICELYLAVIDAHKPVKGQRRFRLESPRLPYLPLTATVVTENDDMNDVIKSTIDRHWKYCDQRVLEKDIAALHPKKELSLSHFIESYIRLVVGGGGGVLRRILTSILHMRNVYPGAVPNFRFYVVPLGYCNDLASWMARGDPLYMQRVFGPIMTFPARTVDSLSFDAMSAPSKATPESLLLRRIVNNYLLEATECNEVVIYQAECLHLDGTMNYIPFISNFELGVHLSQAASTEGVVMGASEIVSTTSFSADLLSSKKSTLGSMRAAQSNFNLNRTATASAFNPNPSSSQSSGSGSFPSAIPTVNLGGQIETIPKVLVLMHGSRGLPLTSRRHLQEQRDVRHCVSGVDILDWISTTFHLYDASASNRAAQAMLDANLLSVASLPMNKDAKTFTENALYTIHPKEDIDTPPECVQSSRSRCVDLASGIIEGIEQSNQPASSSNALKVRVTFTPQDSDLTYTDLLDSSAPVREIISLKLKSTGSAGDKGSLPDPSTIMLHLTINEVEKRRPGSEKPRVREIVDQYEHYQLRYGEGRNIEPRCVFNVESKAPPAPDGTPTGIFCAIDGDVFGPFASVRVRPIIAPITTAQQAALRKSASLANMGAANMKKDLTAATLTVMSYIKCSPS